MSSVCISFPLFYESNFLLVGRSGRSKGFGFVKFQNAADQNGALNKLDKVESLGRVLTVKIALNPEPVPEGEPANDQKVGFFEFDTENNLLNVIFFRRKSKFTLGCSRMYICECWYILVRKIKIINILKSNHCLFPHFLSSSRSSFFSELFSSGSSFLGTLYSWTWSTRIVRPQTCNNKVNKRRKALTKWSNLSSVEVINR